MLKFKAVMARTGLSRQQLFVKRTAGTFPPGVTLSKGVLGWDQADVDAWIADPAGYRAKS
jgi:prophage regulatory protein